MAFLIVIIATFSSCKNKKTDPQSNTTESFRFIFMADSRGDSIGDQINLPVINAIISKIGTLSPKPTFIIFAGDMLYRGIVGGNPTYQTWKDLFAPLTNNGIKLYTTIGNHELYNEHSDSAFMLANQQAFQNAFPDNPTNGPQGYDHLTYSFTSPGGTCFFAILDPYYLTGNIAPPVLGGNIDSVQMSWLRTQVAQTKAKHKFLFIHTPYYYVYDELDEPSAANESYTKLWSFLDDNNFDFYACGHSHLFSRRTIDASILPNPQTTPPTPSWKNNVTQLLCGTTGAGPSSAVIDPAFKAKWNVHNNPKIYYFSVVDVLGATVRVNSYSGYTGDYTIFDTYTVNK